MRLIYRPFLGIAYTKPDCLGLLWGFDGHTLIAFDSQAFRFFDFERTYIENKFFVYNNALYRYKMNDASCVPDYSSFRDGKIDIVDGAGRSIANSPELKKALGMAISLGRVDKDFHNGKLYSVIYEYDSKESAMFVFDVASSTHILRRDVGIDAGMATNIGYVGFDTESRRLVCVGPDLSTKWSFHPGYRPIPVTLKGPETYQDLVIYCFGTSRRTTTPGGKDRWGREQEDNSHYHDCRLYGLDMESGAVRWEIVIPDGIGSFQIDEGCLYLSSRTLIYKLDAATGGELNRVSTGLTDRFNAGFRDTKVKVFNEYLYFLHPEESRLLVYEKAALNPIQNIDIPNQEGAIDYLFCHEPSGKLYFKTTAINGSAGYHHWQHMLEVDPANLGEPIEIVEGPPVEVELRPAAGHPDEVELWVTMKDIPLIEALFYGTKHVEDQAYYHGRQLPIYVTHTQTPNFNGVVHFRYRAEGVDVREAERMFAIMEQRFQKWAELFAFAPTDPTKPAMLDAKYLVDG